MKKTLKNHVIYLLITLAEYRLLSATQIALLEDKNNRSVRRMMKQYLELEYVETISRSYTGSKGRPESLYCLSKKGVKILTENQLFDPLISYEKIVWEGKHNLEHQIGVNWVLIYVSILERFRDLIIHHISHTSPFHPETENGIPFIYDFVPVSNDQNKQTGFTPDAVINIESPVQKKSLLFFLEYDRSTESLTGGQSNSILQKIKNYQNYFRYCGYKRYENHFNCSFKGFRLLFVCESEKRLHNLCRLVQGNQPSNFIWLTTLDAITSKGIGANIWVSGGIIKDAHESILGPTLTFDLSLTA